jgi:Fe(3+) dicitrate transport protein
MIETLRAMVEALALPLTDPASRTFAPALIVAAILALAWHKIHRLPSGNSGALGLGLWRHPSSLLDLQLLIARRLLSIIGVIPVLGGAWWLATRISTTLDGLFGIPTLHAGPWVGVAYTLVLFLFWDLSRFIVHLALHKVPWLWSFHQIHHSAEVLTPLTFHRTHPIESLVYSLRGVLTTGSVAGVAFWLYRGTAVEITLLGVHSVGLILNALTGNLRHSHLWIRFPAAMERWLISPAQHQMHHALAAAHHNANLGTWLACWDRMAGTLQIAPATPVTAIGLQQPNHNPHQLLSALFAPFRDAFTFRKVRHLATMLALLLPLNAIADDADDADDPEDAVDGAMIITADRGTPRVAGAAHIITEEVLARHAYTDIHKVLAAVPGVYVRDEDGFGLRPNIGLRGGNSDRSAKITLMEDGVPISPAPYAAPAAYYFPMTMRMVGVEVIKGSAAIRHGPQTIGGAVNLLTRRVPFDSTVAALTLGYGAHNTLKAHGYSGHGDEHWGVLGEVSHLSSAGFKALDGGGPTGFVRSDAMLKGRWGTDKSEDVYSEVELKLGYGREVSNETYLGLTAADFKATPDRRYAASADDQMQWNRQQASLVWRLLMGQDLDLRTVVYHHRLDRAWGKVNGFADGTNIHDLLYADPTAGQAEAYLAVLQGRTDTNGVGDRILKGTNDRQFSNTGVATTGHWRLNGETIANELEFGLRWHSDDVVRLHTERPYEMRDGRLTKLDAPTETTLDSHSTAHALAFHLHNDFTVGRLSLLPGIRHERITTQTGTHASGPIDPKTHSIWLPGMGAYLQATDEIGLLAGVNRGFSPIPPGSPADAVAETAWNMEAGLRLSHGAAHAEFVGFLSDYDNLTGQCTLSGGCTDAQLDTQHNGGAADVRGIEATAGHLMPIGGGFSLGLDAAYALTDAQFSLGFLSEFPQFGRVESGDVLPYVPTHQGQAALRVEHERGLLSTAFSWRSGMRNQAGTDPEPHPIGPSLSLDVAGEYRINDHFSTTASVTNLSNHRAIASWRPFGARPTPPRSWMFGLKAAL